MPELPEVETIRRQLAPHLEGRTIARAEVLDARWSEPAAPAELADAIEGREVLAVGRRGKYFDVELDGEVHLVMHLRMTGNLLLIPPDSDTPSGGTGGEQPYVRVRFELDDGSTVLFADPRRFGTGLALLGDDAREEKYSSRASTRCGPSGRCGGRRSRRCTRRSSSRSRPESTRAERRSTTSAIPTGRAGASRTASSSTAARASRVRAAGRRS